jgi:hypothetical protein
LALTKKKKGFKILPMLIGAKAFFSTPLAVVQKS